LIFYDTETSGTSSAFDQILQFAAIRTDGGLGEVGRFEIRSRLLPYVVPAPGALRVTRMSIEQLSDPDRPSHYEMVCELRRVLGAWCPAAFIGYNSLRFDEEFLRQAFYQCLHPPYLTNTGGSNRADALHLVRAASVIEPDLLNIPINEKGNQTFKLDRLGPANGCNDFNAHDALADVEALIHICQIIKEALPDLWERFLKFANKAAVEDFLRREEVFLLMQFHPVSTGSYFVTAIGSNNANAAYCFDLSLDPHELLALTDDELVERLGRAPKPIRVVKKNAAPTLAPLNEVPAHLLDDVDVEQLRGRACALRSDKRLTDRLVAAANALEVEYPPSPHVERQIYQGFWSNADAQRLNEFHTVGWERRLSIAKDLEDPRLRWLARRLIFGERPELLSNGAVMAVRR